MLSAIAAQSVQKNRSGEAVLEIDHCFSCGKVYGVLGNNGSGKSTLMRQLALLLTPTRGSVTVFGATVTDMDALRANALRQRLGIMFQNGALFDFLTVYENLRLGAIRKTQCIGLAEKKVWRRCM